MFDCTISTAMPGFAPGFPDSPSDFPNPSLKPDLPTLQTPSDTPHNLRPFRLNRSSP
jgi:hypothetical protein